ncbi:ATP-binding protein [Actinomadura welshii]|uniref:ATP-binding protein n=1 Tax=Actinomadura welshii TaxID=3103817 RepID=UPI0013789564|nr:helix-turn-helix domain-containing protein [Actinomadura madurae]
MSSVERASIAALWAPGDEPPVGVLVRWWRERALLTQEQLAERTGLNVRTIRRLESRELQKPRPTSILLLAEALRLNSEERAILVAGVRGPVSSPAGGETVIPRQLPARVDVCEGRAQELLALERDDDAGMPSMVSIEGMPGIGKTALAVHAAHRLMPRFPDGQLYLDLHGHRRETEPVEPGAALTRLLGSLGVTGGRVPEHLDDRAALYRSVLAGRRVLIVLDDAAGEEQVRPLLPAGAGCRLIVTSRRRLIGLDGVRTVPLDVPAADEAVALFTRTAGPARVKDAPAAVLTEIVERCGLLPLAVRIAAVRLCTHPAWTVRDLLDRLNDDRPGELRAGSQSVAAALDLSYRRLPADQRSAYRSLGAHLTTDFGVHAAAAMLETPVARTRWLLDRLLDAHLLQEPTPDRFRFHTLVREHARRTAQGISAP